MGALKNTPLQQYHVELGAKMAPVAGWNMPVQYPGGSIAEHLHTRSECGLFDTSHMGEYQISGKGCAAALDFLLARKVSDLKIGSCQYNFLLAEDGGVLDDLLVCRMAEEDFFFVVTPGNVESDAAWLSARLPEGVTLRDLSADLAKFDLQGPKAAEVFREFDIVPARLPGFCEWTILDLDGIRCIVSRTGRTGELGFELFFSADFAPALWESLLEIPPVRPVGLGALDTLRLEMGYPLYGRELNARLSPLDCGIEALIRMDEARGSFLAREALLHRKVVARTIGVVFSARQAVRAGSEVLDADGSVIGTVTSGVFCPSLDKAAALCRIGSGIPLKEGDPLFFMVGEEKTEGRIASPPFLKNTSLRTELQ